MIILGAEPDQQLLKYIQKWIEQYNEGEAEALLFDRAKSCLMVGTLDSNFKWVMFWDPFSKNGFAPTHWYDWSAIPAARRSSLLKLYRECRTKFDDRVLQSIEHFSTKP